MKAQEHSLSIQFAELTETKYFLVKQQEKFSKQLQKLKETLNIRNVNSDFFLIFSKRELVERNDQLGMARDSGMFEMPLN